MLMIPTMFVQASTLLTALLVSCLAAVANSQGGGSCLERLFDDVVDCFGAQGLDLMVQAGQQDATKLMRETQAMDPSVQCRQKESYKAAIKCSLTALKQCLVAVDMGGAIPDPDKFQQGMDVVCDRLDDFNSQCLKSHYQHILSCGEQAVKTVVQESSESLSMDDVICLSADVNYDCAKQSLQSCDKDTLAIYLEQLDKYQVPSACANKSPGRKGRRSYTIDNSGVTPGLGVIAGLISLALHLLCH